MNKVTASSLLLIAQKGAERSLGIISTLILARLLTPEDFGIIAIAMLVLWFVETLSSAGTDVYIIQKDHVLTSDIDSAWTLDLILKNISFLMLAGAAPIISYFQDNSDLFYVILGIGLTLPFKSITNPGLWILRREQTYSSIVKAAVFTKFCSLLIVIPLAYVWQNYWAIVIGQVFSAFLSTVFSYKISRYRPKLCTLEISEQWKFSKWLIPQSVLGYFRIHIDTLIVGAKFLEADLGAYNNLKYFSSIPMLQVITPLSAPLHAELGKVQKNAAEILFQSAIAVKLFSFIAAPFAAMSLVASEEIVYVILGEQWVQYHLIFGYLGLMVIPFILFTQASRILMVRKKTKIIFLYEVMSTVTICLLLGFAFVDSLERFAFLRVLSEFIFASLFFLFTNKLTFLTFSFNSYLTLIISTGLCSVCLFVLKEQVDDLLLKWQVLISVGFFSIVVTAILFLIWYFIFATDRERKATIKFSPFG